LFTAGIVRRFFKLVHHQECLVVLLQKDVQVCVVGKVFKPDRLKVSALNKALLEGYRSKIFNEGRDREHV